MTDTVKLAEKLWPDITRTSGAMKEAVVREEQIWAELEVLFQKIHARNAHIPSEQVDQDVGDAIRELRIRNKQ